MTEISIQQASYLDSDSLDEEEIGQTEVCVAEFAYG